MFKKYTKGDKNKVVTRINQVSSITVNVPTSDKSMDYLYDALISLCNHYVDENDGDLKVRYSIDLAKTAPLFVKLLKKLRVLFQNTESKTNRREKRCTNAFADL